MARAAEQHTPTEWGEDRWTLDEIFDYLTKAVGYPEERALYEMERARLARRLVLRVQKIVDGKPQGDPEYLPFNKKHKLIRDLGWVVPQNHKWGDNRWTEYRQVILDLWPSRPPAALLPPGKPTRPSRKRKETSETRLVEIMKDISLEKSGLLPREVLKAVKQPYKDKYHDEPSQSAVTRAYNKYQRAE
jgi:hypothetical protein